MQGKQSLGVIVICSETEVQLGGVRETVNLQEVTLDNHKQRASVNEEQQRTQTITLRYPAVKRELSRKRPIDGD